MRSQRFLACGNWERPAALRGVLGVFPLLSVEPGWAEDLQVHMLFLKRFFHSMILWGETDPIAPPAWADRLGETFSHLLGVQFLPDIGHFVPFEAPEAVVEAIRTVL